MKRIVLLTLGVMLFVGLIAQDAKKVGGFMFTPVKDIQCTSVKDQYRSGTCWCFSGSSFIESEIMRMGKGEYDISEMFTIRNAYKEKAEQYVRWHGLKNFGGGGEFHDVMNMIKKYGMVPQEVYPGFLPGDKKPVHNEMDGVLKAIVDQIVKNPNGKLSPVWPRLVDDVLDEYLGKYPTTFTYKSKTFTPQSFAKETGLNPDDYVEITSYTHHPFYQKFIMEVQDNWADELINNVPIDEFGKIIENAIMNGYTIGWGSDVSDEGFSFKKGVAIVPEKEWTDMEKKEKDSIFNKPIQQRKITQEMRQTAFDNYMTSDDHGMHIVGLYKDQLGQKYYKVKNSWGVKGSDYEGYFYASEAFILLETTTMMVHKDAIPKDIAKKLGIK